MTDHKQPIAADRRAFLKTVGAAALALGTPSLGAERTGAAVPAAQTPAKVRMGVDMYSLGAQNWTPFQALEWAAKMNVNMLHFSEVRFLGSTKWQEALAPDNLKKIRDKADELKVDIEIGMRSICPTSTDFASAQRNDPTLGTADEQIARMLVAAKALRSPIVRCVQGVGQDRQTGIEKHIGETIKVLKANRSRILDSGIKLAVENHAGDMQAREMKMLIEGGGPDIVGVCLDSGNPFWANENPHLTLETLAPYTVTSHMRDSYVFNSPQGIASQWTRMGDGNMGMEEYIRAYVQKCPGKPVSLEVIVQGANAWRIFNYRDPAAWALFQNTPAWEFARLLSLAEKGVPKELPPPGQGRGGGGGRGAGAPAAGAPAAGATPNATPAAPAAGGGRQGGPNPAAQQRNLEDVEVSVKWTQAVLAKL
ncbi:MAG: sugar phosphate isomerase/epimerase [Vicinamibacterales bacterium]